MNHPITSTRLAIVGTAGHIDHGKTSMVRRITGVDTDRLPEEKKRGISIDLGFAPLVTPGGVHVGIVDVPGHERFVKNMLAGSGGVDLVLLVIAADEGVMPQTREHLAIVKLLGVRRAIVVLSKCDMVEREWIALVKKDVAALMVEAGLGGGGAASGVRADTSQGGGAGGRAGGGDSATLLEESASRPTRAGASSRDDASGFETTPDRARVPATGHVASSRRAPAAVPIVEFSAVTGAGTDALMAELDRQLEGVTARGTDQPARLPVDRVFVMEGFGTVVTGTLWRGVIKTGESLSLLPAGKPVRVRRVQVHGETVEEARAGQRTAIALHGVSAEEVARGDWIVATDSLHASQNLDVRFELLRDAREFKSGTRVRFHLGASELLGRVVLLEGRTLKAGESALAQVRLDTPAVAARGDRFVVRSWSPMRTVGGGAVIEPVASRRRGKGAKLESLAVHESGSLEARLLERLALERKPTATAVLAQAVGEKELAVDAALSALVETDEVVSPVAGRWVARARWAGACDAIANAVRAYVAKHPARYGVLKGELKRDLKSSVEAAMFDACFGALVSEKVLEQRGEHVRPAGEPWEPPAEMMRALEKLEAQLEADGLSPPENKVWQTALGPSAAEVAALGFFLERLVRVSGDLTYTRAQMSRLHDGLTKAFEKKPALTVADFRDLFGTSRKYSVPLAEHCDRVGWTVRVGDERRRGGA